MNTLDAGPSHTVALAVAIIMQDRNCQAGVAFESLRDSAAQRGMDLHGLAETVVADGAAPTAPARVSVAGD